MKKTLAIVGGVIIVAAAGITAASWYTGKRLQSENEQQIELGNAQLAQIAPALGLAIEQRDYHRGIFSSHARYVLSSSLADKSYGKSGVAAPTAPVDPDSSPRLIVELDMQHGPFPWRRVKFGHFAPMLTTVHAEVAKNITTEPLFRATGGVTPLSADYGIDYRGNGDYVFSIPPAAHQQEESNLTFSGMKASGSFKRADNTVTLHGGTDKIALTLAPAGGKVDIVGDGLSVDLSTRAGKFGLSIGDGKMLLKQLTVTQRQTGQDALPGMATRNTTTLSDVGYSVKIDEDDRNLSGQAAYEIGAIKVGDTGFGSGKAVLTFRKLDGVAVKTLSDRYNRLSTLLVLDRGQDQNNANNSEQTIAEMMDGAHQLLAGQPTFGIEPLSWKNDKGEHRFQLSLDLGPLPPATSAADGSDPMLTSLEMIKRLDASLTVSKPAAKETLAEVLVAQGTAAGEARTNADDTVESAVQMAQGMNLARIEGDNAESHFHYADGMVDINGQKMTLPAFLSQFGLARDTLDSDAGPESSPADPMDGAMDGKPGGTGTTLSIDTQTVGRIVDDAGLAYVAEVGEQGEPLMKLDPADTGAEAIDIEFHACKDGAHCGDILLRATFATPKAVPLKTVNEWNLANRWLRAYVNKNGKAVIEQDIGAAGGIGAEALNSGVTNFLQATYDFGDVVSRPAEK